MHPPTDTVPPMVLSARGYSCLAYDDRMADVTHHTRPGTVQEHPRLLLAFHSDDIEIPREYFKYPASAWKRENAPDPGTTTRTSTTSRPWGRSLPLHMSFAHLAALPCAPYLVPRGARDPESLRGKGERPLFAVQPTARPASFSRPR